MTVRVGVRELRENLASWLDRAAAGEDIVITERGRPKARLSPAETAYERMVREGSITPASGPPSSLPPAIPIRGSTQSYLDWARGRPEPDPDAA